MDVVGRFREYDGKRVTPFRAVVEHLGVSQQSFDLLLKLAAEGEDALEIGATWGLKAMLEAGLAPTESHARAAVELLATAQAPDATLHLLQILPYLPPVADLEQSLYDTLLTHVASNRKFVKAWAYNGLGLLAQQNPQYLSAVNALFDRAMATESASVKARIRNVRKDAVRILKEAPADHRKQAARGYSREEAFADLESVLDEVEKLS